MTTQTEAQRLEAEVQALRGAVPAVPDWSKMYAAPAAPQPAAQQEPAPGRCKLCNGSGVGNSGVHSLCICQYGGAAPQPAAQPTEPAYTEAVSLATALFKKHFAHEEHYASGRIVWAPCDTTAGVISQIDNMVSRLIQPAVQQDPAGEPVGVVVATRWNADGVTTRHAASFRDSAAIKAGDLLYTRPAVPLTDEQIEALFKGVDSEDKGRFSIVRGFARAVEAAHGIAP
jgi:hypothetical protein